MGVAYVPAQEAAVHDDGPQGAADAVLAIGGGQGALLVAQQWQVHVHQFHPSPLGGEARTTHIHLATALSGHHHVTLDPETKLCFSEVVHPDGPEVALQHVGDHSAVEGLLQEGADGQ